MTERKKVIKVGDWVWWAAARGRPPEAVRVRFIDKCAAPGVKYGTPVERVNESDLQSCTVSLENGRWAFGIDIAPLTEAEYASVVARIEIEEEAA